MDKTEATLLDELRKVRRKHRNASSKKTPPLTAGQRIADVVASTMGSWRFIIIQSCILLAWIALNITAWVKHWDPYPFIMMSQNRQQDVDRAEAENDYRINVKAELEIELLHEKLDLLRDSEIAALTRAVDALSVKRGPVKRGKAI